MDQFYEVKVNVVEIGPDVIALYGDNEVYITTQGKNIKLSTEELESLYSNYKARRE